MKKILALLLMVSLLLSAGCTAVPENEGTVIVASFYPIYIFAKNLVDGIPDVTLYCMAEQNTGCLHDYRLLAKDVKRLENADAFLINGAGMEDFLGDVTANTSNLSVIDSSTGISLLSAYEGQYTHSDDANSHIWMSVKNAMKQVENLADGLKELMPQDSDKIEVNEAAYLIRLNALHGELIKSAAAVGNAPIITFHEAYDYMANDLSLHIVRSIESDEGGEPSAKELSEITEEIREFNIKALFTEPQYKGSAAEILSNETGIPIYVLNPCVQGEDNIYAYEDIMRENLRLMAEAVR